MAETSISRPAIRSRTSKAAHIIERIGLAMAGGSCGLFVAAHMANSRVEAFGSLPLVVGLMILGAVSFYLGIDIPPHRSAGSDATNAEVTDPVELFSAIGTFLATLAAFLSVYIIVFDANPSTRSTIILGICWLVGGIMQIVAGISARRHQSG
ncbi:mannose/fructose/N-acetylgalactosamine-specific phosphotransferase system component IID [Nitrobacteraceae bacterium AZCC 1564]